MKIETVDYTASDAGDRLARSLRETGFAVLANHPIRADRVDEAYALWGGFFASDIKLNYVRDYEKQDGYFPFKSEHAKDAQKKDLKEFYHVYPWGRVPEELEAFTRQLYADLTEIGVELLSWLDQQMPEDVSATLSMPLQEMMQASQQSLLRILHYPPVSAEEDEAAIRAAAHEDINLITLLLAGSQPGLQARDKQGQWHDVPCDPGMITINNGDMLSLATNGYFPSTTHRVINPDVKLNLSRYSMPMFLHPHPDVKLRHDFTAEAFLQERLKEIGLKS
ncbi:MAG: isopenicillin N synthase family dioxygenase [Candidatus Puniceispirillaceae bacterium]